MLCCHQLRPGVSQLFAVAIEQLPGELIEPALPFPDHGALLGRRGQKLSELVWAKSTRLSAFFPKEKATLHDLSQWHETSESAPVIREHSRICAPMVMTENKRAQAAIPHQDTRNLSCPAWFSTPRGTTCITKFHREMKDMRRIGHGSARAIEGLRRVWLPLVSGPDSREYLLQGV